MYHHKGEAYFTLQSKFKEEREEEGGEHLSLLNLLPPALRSFILAQKFESNAISLSLLSLHTLARSKYDFLINNKYKREE